MLRHLCRLICIIMFLVCLFLLQLDDCVLCRVYRTDERIYKRSRDASRLDESGPSGSKIPRLDLNPNLNEVNNPYEEIQMPLQAQQPQPRTEIFQAPQEPDHFALQSNTQFPILDPSVLMPPPTPQPSIHCIGNEFGGQGLDNFDIMNGAIGNSSFDAGNGIDFGNVPDWNTAIDFGIVPGFDSTDYGNSGLYRMIDYGNYAFKHEWHLRPAAMVVVIYAGFSGHSSVLV